jgi:hypothetical protein
MDWAFCFDFIYIALVKWAKLLRSEQNQTVSRNLWRWSCVWCGRNSSQYGIRQHIHVCKTHLQQLRPKRYPSKQNGHIRLQRLPLDLCQRILLICPVRPLRPFSDAKGAGPSCSAPKNNNLIGERSRQLSIPTLRYKIRFEQQITVIQECAPEIRHQSIPLCPPLRVQVLHEGVVHNYGSDVYKLSIDN